MSNSAQSPEFYDILLEEYMFLRPPGAATTLSRSSMPVNSSSRPFQSAPKIGLHKRKSKGVLDIENPVFEPVVDCLMAGYLHIANKWGEEEAGKWRVHWEKDKVAKDGVLHDGPVLVFWYTGREIPSWDDEDGFEEEGKDGASSSFKNGTAQHNTHDSENTDMYLGPLRTPFAIVGPPPATSPTPPSYPGAALSETPHPHAHPAA